MTAKYQFLTNEAHPEAHKIQHEIIVLMVNSRRILIEK